MQIDINKRYKIRYGYPVDNLHIVNDKNDPFPVKGYVLFPQGKIARSWDINGNYYHKPSDSDLIEIVDPQL